MKQVGQNYRSGELTVLDVPQPACKPGGVLVRSLYSLISTGTEMMKVSEARLSLLGKARARPDQVRKVLDSMAQQGPVATYKKAMDKLDSYTPLGYSLCGVVVEVGAGAEEFAVGDVVAAAGNEFALHAEVNWVPVNLCVPVPEGVDAKHAAFATVGAIAMHGVRRGEPQLGETACVIGLGLVGQLVVRLLVAAGVRVVGIDTVEERCRLAEAAGAMSCASPDDEGAAYIEQVVRTATGGLGADHVFLAAGGDTNGPVELAARLVRDRARVVDIGKTRLDLPWNAYYEKELDVRFSRSYGPGRYDDRYELDGIDYPAGYVRWTERRNLGCFLDLLAGGTVDVSTLVSATRPIEDAVAVYEELGNGALRGVGFLFEYPSDAAAPGRRREAGGPGRPRRPDAGAPTGPPRVTDRPARLRRRRQLRVVDAAAAPREAPGRHARAGRDDAVAVGGQRPAQVRLRVGDDRCGGGALRPRDRRGLRRDAAPLPRRLRVPRTGTGQGGVRREASRAHPGPGRRHPRRRRAHGERPDHGGFQPALRPPARGHAAALRHHHRSGDRALPRQRRTDGLHQLVPRRAARRLEVPR